MSADPTAVSALGCLLAGLAVAACGEAKVGTLPTGREGRRHHARARGRRRAIRRAPPAPAARSRRSPTPRKPTASRRPHRFTTSPRRRPRRPAKRRSPPGAPSDAEVQARARSRCRPSNAAPNRRSSTSSTPVPGGESIGGNGTIPIPTNVPEVVQKVIAGANEIADFPYVFGGGHASFIDNAYDCSGSVSYALAAGGLLSAPETSGDARELGRARARPVHHRLRERRAHLHVRRRDPLRHRRAQRRVRLALAGQPDRQHRLRRAPLARACRRCGGAAPRCA